MPADKQRIDDLDHAELVRFILDIIHRSVLHYGLWFTEVRHQMGTARALGVLKTAYERSLEIQMNRLSKVFGFELEGGLPKALLETDRAGLKALLEGFCTNWLANDGVWFQAVEFKDGMNDAKRCNDSCWGQFSPIEAWSIKRLLALPERPGLAGLTQALGFRIYAQINTQSIIEEGPDSLVFRMNECRVQSARKRKGLDDYPCKSAGLVEYTYFARSIDERVRTECIGCPPDPHPDDWSCAWRFTLRP
ncbi:MAG: DUF6125 family protein [Desulfobacterales bacterium]